jgi:hypothetical protein
MGKHHFWAGKHIEDIRGLVYHFQEMILRQMRSLLQLILIEDCQRWTMFLLVGPVYEQAA